MELNKIKLDIADSAPTQSIKDIVNGMVHPVYQSFHFNVDSMRDLSIGKISLYSQELQKGLESYPSEREKMMVMTKHLVNPIDHFVNDGGSITLGVAGEFGSAAGDGILARTSTLYNDMIFSALKGTSVYPKYLFDLLDRKGLTDIFGGLYSYAFSALTEVKTYTIVYIVGETTIREVTLFNLKQYGNILTTLNMKHI